MRNAQELHLKLVNHFQVKLADPDVVSNPSEYQKLAQSMAELDEVPYLTVILSPFLALTRY